MVFMSSPCRETPKNVLKKKSRKKSRMLGGWVWDSANVRGGPSICFRAAPRPSPSVLFLFSLFFGRRPLGHGARLRRRLHHVLCETQDLIMCYVWYYNSINPTACRRSIPRRPNDGRYTAVRVHGRYDCLVPPAAAHASIRFRPFFSSAGNFSASFLSTLYIASFSFNLPTRSGAPISLHQAP
jgi:hypothetical protein